MSETGTHRGDKNKSTSSGRKRGFFGATAGALALALTAYALVVNQTATDPAPTAPVASDVSDAKLTAAKFADDAAKDAKADRTATKASKKKTAKKLAKQIARRADQARRSTPPPSSAGPAVKPTRKLATAGVHLVQPKSLRSTVKQTSKPSKALKSSRAYKLDQISPPAPLPAAYSTWRGKVAAAAATGTGSFAGTISDKATGLPVAGACVRAFPYRTEVDQIPIACANNAGAYQLSGLAADRYDLVVSDEIHGHLRTFTENIVLAEGQARTGVNFAMVQGGAISGKVTKAGGAPLAGICVEVYDDNEDYYDEACTNASGVYQTGGIPAGDDWTVSFRDTQGPYLPQYFDGVEDPDDATPVEVEVGSVTDHIDAQMVRGGSISGTVTDTATGDPVKDVCVRFSDDAIDEYASRCTGADGKYTSPGLRAGSYTVRFDDNSGDGYRQEYYDDVTEYDDATPVPVTLGNDHPGIDADLLALGRISGKVTAKVGGAPIADECVYAVSDDEDSDGYDAETHADGTYLLVGLPNGSYKVGFGGCGDWKRQWFDGVDDKDDATAVEATVGSTVTGINGKLTLLGSISGTVTVQGTGTPAEDVCVEATNVDDDEEDGEGRSAVTAADGKYRVGGLRAGVYNVYFYDCGDNGFVGRYYGGTQTSAGSTKVTVVEATNKPNINQAMRIGGKITGTVTFDATGDPFDNACVQASPANVEDGDYASTQTDENGEYEIIGLETGSYQLQFIDCDKGEYLSTWLGGSDDREGSETVAVTLGGTTPGADAALKIGGTITGKVADAATGNGLNRVCISATTASDPDGDTLGNATREDDGSYRISGLPTGSYVVRFQDCDEGTYAEQWFDGASSIDDATPVEVTAGTDTPDVDAAMVTFGGISGTISDSASGDPIKDACAVAYSASDLDSPVESGCTEEDGKYTIPGLPDGQYVVEFPGSGKRLGEWYNDKPSGQDADLIQISTGDSVSGVDASLGLAATVSGKITAGGEVIEDGCANLVSATTGESVDYECGSGDGSYLFEGVPAGSYKVAFYRYNSTYKTIWFDQAVDFDSATTVTVAVGDERTGIDADFPDAGGHSISGALTIQETGAPAVGRYCPQVYTSGNDYVGDFCQDTTSSGGYRLDGLQPGSYKIQFVPTSNAPGIAEWYDGAATIEDADPVTVGSVDVTGINASLRTGGKISGSVTDAATGQPFASGACVYLNSTGGDFESYSTCVSGGAYTSPEMAAGSYTVSVNDGSGPYLSQTRPNPVPVTLGGSVTGVNFALVQGGTVSGTLRDDATNAPLSNICVTAFNSSDVEVGDQNCSDGNGHYVTDGLPAGSYRFQFTNGGGRYVSEYFDNVSSLGAATSVPVTLGANVPGKDAKLVLGGVITGTVTSARTGDPLKDICVKVYKTDGSFGGVGGCTDVNGVYATAPVPPGQYKVGFEDAAGAFVDQYFDGKATLAAATAVTVTAGGTRKNVDAALASNGVSGTVTDAKTGDPLGGVCVYLYTSGGSYSGNGTCTGDDGTYDLDGIAAGSYQAAFFDPSGTHVTQWFDGAATQAAATVLVAPGDLSSVDAAMAPITTVVGTVTDSVTEAPLDGVRAYLYKVGQAGASAGAVTGIDGRAVFQGIAPGDYQLAYADSKGVHDTHWFDGSGDRAGSTVLHVTDGSIIRTDAALVPITTLVGTAKDAASGNLLAGVCAYLYKVGSPNSSGAACTGADGKVVFQGIDAGQYQLAYNDSSALHATEWFGGSHLRSGASTITLSQGEAKLDANVLMDLTGKITGTVTNGSGPVADVCVYADDINGTYTGVGYCTKADGKYTLTDLSPGSYKLGYYPEGMPTPSTIWYLNGISEATATPVVVQGGQTTSGINQTVP